jgi:hypothetical protein
MALQQRAGTRLRRWRGQPAAVFEYADAAMFFLEDLEKFPPDKMVYPCAVPNWDNSPRSGRRGVVLHESTPELFRQHLRQAMQRVESLPRENQIVFVKSWNEWAEGNYLEPDRRFGLQYLDVVRDEVRSSREPSRPLR